MADEQASNQKENGKNRHESLGEYLKRERLLRNITLEEISRLTKIGQRFLKALEDDNYQALPGEAFVKGFLRTYAKAIGLEPNEIILIYDEYTKTQEGRGALKSLEDSEEEGIPKGPVSSSLIVAIVIVVLLSGSAYFGWDYFRQRESGQEVNEAEVPAVQSQPSQSISTGEQHKTGPKKVLPSHIAKWEPLEMEAQAQSDAQWLNSSAGKSWLDKEKNHLFANGLSLSVKARSDIWVKINSDPPDGVKEKVFLNAGTLKIWFAKEKFVLSLSKPDGVKLELNGIEINPFSKKNSSQEITLTRDNMR